MPGATGVHAGPGLANEGGMTIPIAHTLIDRVTEYRLADYPLLTIGRFSYINEFARIVYYGLKSPVRIGNFSSIAANVTFFTRTGHHPEWLTTYPIEWLPWDSAVPKPPHPGSAGDAEIVVGSDVWIGDGARLLPGITIGDGAVIGAGAVVTKDVPPYAVFVGNPGRVVRQRFAQPEIDFLLAARWWELPTATVARLAPLIAAADVGALKRELTKLSGPGALAAFVPSRAIVNLRQGAWMSGGRRAAKLRRSLRKRMDSLRRIFGAAP